MSSKEEIKVGFSNELMNTPQYQLALLVKQFILDEISRPNIAEYVIYTYENPITREDVKILKMCLYLLFGFNVNDISENNVLVDMKKFLE